VDPRFNTFINRHGGSADGAVATIAQDVHAGTITLVSVSDGVSAQHIARIYDIRAGIAGSKGRHESAAQFAALSTKCGKNHDASCSIWILAGAGKTYGIFEMMPSHEIVGCLEFAGGTVDIAGNDA
jgi:hypothetical protein